MVAAVEIGGVGNAEVVFVLEQLELLPQLESRDDDIAGGEFGCGRGGSCRDRLEARLTHDR